MAKAKPKQRVREEERPLRRMEYTMKNRALFDRERMMRELRSARLQADQLENYLTNLNSAHRGAADYTMRIKRLVARAYGGGAPQETTPGMPARAEALRYFPTSYPNIRYAVGDREMRKRITFEEAAHLKNTIQAPPRLRYHCRRER